MNNENSFSFSCWKCGEKVTIEHEPNVRVYVRKPSNQKILGQCQIEQSRCPHCGASLKLYSFPLYKTMDIKCSHCNQIFEVTYSTVLKPVDPKNITSLRNYERVDYDCPYCGFKKTLYFLPLFPKKRKGRR